MNIIMSVNNNYEQYTMSNIRPYFVFVFIKYVLKIDLFDPLFQ